MIPLMVRLLAFPLKLLRAPFRWITPRVGCLILILFAVVLFVSCGMLGRLTLTF